MKWSEDLATGITRVDEQHRTIFRMADEYRVTLNHGQGEGTYKFLLDFLERYIRVHFGFEDRCMEHYQCPAARENRAAHAEFTDTLAEFRQRFSDHGYRDPDARELVDTLDRWFAEHIARVDVALRAYAGGPGGAG